MTNPSLKVLLVEDSNVSAQTVRMMLSRADNAMFDVKIAGSLMEALDLLGNASYDVILLDLGLPDSDGIGTLTTIRVHSPHVPVIVLTGKDNDSLANSALQYGAQDYIIKGQFDASSLTRSLRYAVTRSKQASANGAETGAKRGGVIGVLGTKGGVGGSTIAIHLAIEARRLTGQEVLLLDFDVIGSTIGFLTKVDRAYTLMDAALSLNRLDAALWESLVYTHPDGIDVLQSPGSTRYGEQLRDERVRHILRFAQTRYAWIVLDMGRFSELSINLLTETTRLILASTTDVPALYEAKRIIQKLNELGYPAVQLSLVLNRASRAAVDTRDLQKTFALPVVACLPEAARELQVAYSSGKLLPPNSPLRKQVGDLCRAFPGITPQEPEQSPDGLLVILRNLWHRLFGSKVSHA